MFIGYPAKRALDLVQITTYERWQRILMRCLKPKLIDEFRIVVACQLIDLFGCHVSNRRIGRPEQVLLLCVLTPHRTNAIDERLELGAGLDRLDEARLFLA